MKKVKHNYFSFNNRQQGSAIVVFMSFFMVSVVLSVGLIGFEFARYQLMISQLKNVLDSATLAGASELAGANTPPSNLITNPNNNNPPNPNFVPNPNFPPPNSNTNQWNAMQAVNFMFTINQNYGNSSSIQSVLGLPLYNATTTNYDTTQVNLNSPGVNKCNLNIGWISTQTDQPTTVTDPYAKIIAASCTYGYQPLFFKFFNLPITYNLPTLVQSRAGVSSMDVAICFDLSGSMDNQTPMILVNRYLNQQYQNNPTPMPNVNMNLYNVPNSGGNYAYNTITNLTAQQSPTGATTSFLPGWLFAYGNSWWGNNNSISNITVPWTYSSNRYNNNVSFGTVAPSYDPEVNPPPANSNPPSISQNNTKDYTDAVVDIFNLYEQQNATIPTYPTIDFNTVYPGQFSGNTTITLPAQLGGGSYNFPDIPTLVEAARGNLESVSTAQAAGLNTSSSSGLPPRFTPKAGYYNAYMYGALQIRYPLALAETAVQEFMSLLNADVDVHFAFIPFGDNAWTQTHYTSGGGTQAIWAWNQNGNWNTTDFAGNALNNGWIQPGTGFTAGAGASSSNYLQIYNAIAPIPTSSPQPETGAPNDPAFSLSMSADGCTNFYAALQQAINQFSPGGNSRISQGAKPFVILFTDGEPTCGNGYGYTEAQTLGQMGVTLNAVGLAQNPAIQTSQLTILSNLVNSNNHHGNAFFIKPGSAASQKQQLYTVFGNISRSMVSLTQ